MNESKIARLEISRRYAWLGPALGVVAMVALFVYGAVAHFPALMVIGGTLAVALIALGASVTVSLDRQLAQARAER
ncbi:hypothetical protein G7070_05140 [Propioniciclava coleopterorum]|uniref:Uncharacterized protein n=1 Tax=Propioniciclava coleopterorum TaxID=2714937 RepID=A0A6G7Y4X9_9ACTN|nr:hypothetical protein [Propioniciclava coleopterorum]QIK71769.1 hypothetical protein G7070_05140 [Propioniciclava coleopterorum]